VDFLAPFHPQIIHTPIVMLIVGLLFELVGRLTKQDWWRKAAFAMLFLGVLGAIAAVLSGNPAGEAAEHAGAPEKAVDAHEEAAMLALWVAIAALVARVMALGLKKIRAAVEVVALVLWLAAAIIVGVAAHRGGMLVFRNGAGVQPHATSAPQAPGTPAGAPAGAPAEGGSGSGSEAKPDKD